MTFGHASFDNWASEGVRTFRTIEAPELKEPNPEGEQCLEMFDEHKNKSLYPNMGGSDLFKPDKRLQFTGVGQCACECYADPDCVAFHIATAHADAQHIDKCWFWSKDVAGGQTYPKNSDERPPTSVLGPADEGHILKPWTEVEAINEARNNDTNGNGNGNDDLSDCPECPPNHMKAKSNGQCTCISGEAIGKGLSTVGKGLGMLALGGVAVTGIVVYGVYRLIRG